MTTLPSPYSARHTGVLDPSAATRLGQQFLADPAHRIAMNAVTTTGVGTVAVNHQRATSIDHTVSHKLDSWAVANQKRSGRCWIFAGLNMLRAAVMDTTHIKDFEYSQTWVHFWDKLEKSNYFLNAMRTLADRPITDRLVQHLLATPTEDGGQWNMFTALVTKYGIVPAYAMPETQSSSNTKLMNRDLGAVLRTGATRIREEISAGGSGETAHTAALRDAYRVLTAHLGIPPTEFDWHWRDKEGTYHRHGRITPLEFAQLYVPADLNDYVCLVHDPRPTSPQGELFTVEYLGNIVGEQVTYLNLPIEDIKQLTATQLQGGHPVWFGCDTEPYSNSALGLWATDLYDYDALYQVDLSTTKAERLMCGQSLMTHAMVFTGVDLDENGCPTKWRVENSWGPDKAQKGFWTMTDDWFSEYVFEIAVPASLLPEKYRGALGMQPHVLPAWDPMGALAD